MTPLIWLILAVVLVVVGAVLIQRRAGGVNLIGGIALIVVGLIIGVPAITAL